MSDSRKISRRDLLKLGFSAGAAVTLSGSPLAANLVRAEEGSIAVTLGAGPVGGGGAAFTFMRADVVGSAQTPDQVTEREGPAFR